MHSLSGAFRFFALTGWPTWALIIVAAAALAVLVLADRIPTGAVFGAALAPAAALGLRVAASAAGGIVAIALVLRLAAPPLPGPAEVGPSGAPLDPAFDGWRIVSLSPLPLPLLTALAALALVAAAVARGSLRAESAAARRRATTLLRVAAALALVLLLAEPGRRLFQTTRIKNRVVFLVDRSASMSFPERVGGPSRSQAAAAFFGGSKRGLADLATRFTLEVYGFERDLEPIDPKRLGEAAPAEGPGTDLVGALRAAASGGAGSAGRKLSGVVLVTDGADNVEMPDGLTPRAKGVLEDLGAPVSTLAVGASGLRDLAIERIAVDDFAFVRNTIEVEAVVRAHGFEAEAIEVHLRREGRLVAKRGVQLVPGRDAYRVSFAFAPDQTGQFVYTVAAPTFPDEAVTTNNARSFVLKVIRDRVRVLLVVGHPSWDERFLRGLLRQDPNVDLISFFILRGTHDDPRVFREDELSLIPFPVPTIFRDELRTFDLVVLQNFAHRDQMYRMEEYLPFMRDYVRDGGALAMIGGENAFGEGRYHLTELQEALPVEPTGAMPSLEPYTARLTAEGRRHPVTQVGSTGAATERIWAEMPALSGLNVTRARPGARVLLEHPFLTDGGANVPAVAVWEFGRGRVLAVTADSSWHWAFPALASGSSLRAYDRFWSNAIRWLVRDPELTPVRIAADKPAIEPDVPIAATVTAHGSDYGPAPGAAIEVDLVDAEQGRRVARQRAVAGIDGAARIEFAPPGPGPYKLVAQATRGEARLGEAEDAVAVRAAGPELSDAAPRPDLLRAISGATGGAFVEIGKASIGDLPLVDPEVVEVGRKRDEPLWDRWYSLAIIAAAIGAEWFLRRRWGYV